MDTNTANQIEVVTGPKSNSKMNEFFRAFKAEWLKNNHVSLGVMTLLVALASVLIVTIVSEVTVMQLAQLGAQVKKNPFANSYSDIVSFHLFFFVTISYPFINALMAARSYSIEYLNNTKRSLYTQPISRTSVFFAKLAFGMSYNALALIFLFVYILIFTPRYIELYEPTLSFSFSHIFNMFLLSLDILIITLPIMSLHIWLSSKKIPQLWNSIILLGITYVSLFLYVDQLPNQWYNFYMFPFAAMNLTVGRTIAGLFDVWAWFGQHSPMFVLSTASLYAIALLYIISKYFEEKDAKF